jgi:hypothetical protein
VIEEKTRFFARRSHRHENAGRVPGWVWKAGGRTQNGTRPVLQTFPSPGLSFTPFIDPGGPADVDQGLQPTVPEAIHPCRAYGYDQAVSVPIDDETGQAVAFGVDQTIGGCLRGDDLSAQVVRPWRRPFQKTSSMTVVVSHVRTGRGCPRHR